MTTNDNLPKAYINLGENRSAHVKGYVEPSAKDLIEEFSKFKSVPFSEALRAVLFAGLSHVYSIEFIPNDLIDMSKNSENLDPKIILETQ